MGGEGLPGAVQIRPDSTLAEARRKAKELKAQITRLGLTVSNVNAFTLFAEGDTYHPTWIDDDELG